MYLCTIIYVIMYYVLSIKHYTLSIIKWNYYKISNTLRISESCQLTNCHNFVKSCATT